MTKPKAITLAVFTVWPFVYMILFMASFFISFMTMGHPNQHSDQMPLMFKIILPLHLLTMVEMMGLMAIYIIHLFKTENVASDKKALWAIVIFMGNILAMPIYWYLYIWKPIKSAPAA
jgi:hypothetical protein